MPAILKCMSPQSCLDELCCFGCKRVEAASALSVEAITKALAALPESTLAALSRALAGET